MSMARIPTFFCCDSISALFFGSQTLDPTKGAVSLSLLEERETIEEEAEEAGGREAIRTWRGGKQTEEEKI